MSQIIELATTNLELSAFSEQELPWLGKLMEDTRRLNQASSNSLEQRAYRR